MPDAIPDSDAAGFVPAGSEVPEPPELPPALALAWGVAASPHRGPKREMSVERIVDAAVELADAKDLSAVSMAAVATTLGFTPMSLYRYVGAKDQLLLLMQEEAMGLPPEDLDTLEGWRAKLTALFEAQVRIFLAHPWVLSLPIDGAPITPGNSAWLEAGLAALADTPLSQPERLAVSLAVAGQARWYGMVMAGYSAQARTSGLSAAEVSARESALYELVITADAYPALRTAIDAGVFTSDDDPFRFALDRSLDGVDSYIAGLEAGGDHAPTTEWIEFDAAQLTGDKHYKAAHKAVRTAEKELAAARKIERQAIREARERLAKTQQS